MRNLMLSAVLCSSFALAGCSGGSALPPVSGDTTISQVQQIAVQVCGYLPAAETVAGIVATFTGGGSVVGIASEVADAICNAVTSKSAAFGRTPRVRGVVLRGRFVR